MKNNTVTFILISFVLFLSGCAITAIPIYEGERKAAHEVAIITPEQYIEQRYVGLAINYTAYPINLNGQRIEAPLGSAIELLPGEYDLDVALVKSFSAGTSIGSGNLLLDAFAAGLMSGAVANQHLVITGHPSQKRSLSVKLEPNKTYKLRYDPYVSDEIVKRAVVAADFWLEDISTGEVQAREMGKFDPQRDIARIPVGKQNKQGELVIRSFPVTQLGSTRPMYIQISGIENIYSIQPAGESLFELDPGEYWVRASGRVDRLQSTSIEDDDRSIKIVTDPSKRLHYTYDPPFGVKSTGELINTTDLSLIDLRMLDTVEKEFDRIGKLLDGENTKGSTGKGLTFTSSQLQEIDVQHLGKEQYRVFAKVIEGKNKVRIGPKKMDLVFPQSFEKSDLVEYVFSIDASDINRLEIVIYRKTIFDYLAAKE